MAEKTKFRKGLEKVLIGGAMVLGSLGVGNEVKGQVYDVNYWVAPNDSTLNFRSSFDLDGDNERTQNDADIGRAYLDGTYTPPQDDKRFIQKFDVNKNGIPGEEDLSKYVQYLEETPFFQPSWYWNKLKTPQERNEFLEKEAALNYVNEIPPISTPPIWDCTQYAQQTMIDMHGFGSPFEIEQLKKVYDYNFEDNGLGGNFPLIDVAIVDYNTEDVPIGSHEMNTVVTGNNALEWNSWNHFEPQTDQTNVQPGEAYIIGENSKFDIRGVPVLEGGNTLNLKGYLRYFIENNQIINVETLNQYTLNQIFERDQINPQISTSLQDGASYQPEANATINVTDDKGLKKSWYSTDDGLTKIALSEGVNNIALPSSEGNLEYIIYAGDDFYNEVLERRDITIEGQGDVTPPEISWNSSASGTHANNIEFNWNITDPNFQDAWISKDDEKQNISQTGSMEFNDLPNGTYKFGIGARDSFGNADSTFEEHTITGVGLEKKLFGDDFNLYPNPSTNGIFNVRYKSENNEVIYEEIFDSSGKLISQESFEGGNERIINLTDAAPGLYLYRLRKSNGETRTEKIIKQ